MYETDERGYNAFELACIKGFKVEQDEIVQTMDGTYITRRFLICEFFFRLKNKAGESLFSINLKNLKDYTNNPLHWAIYRADQ